MDVVERTAMRVVVEHRAPGTALVTLGLSVAGALAAGIQLLRTGEPVYALGLAAAGAAFVVGLWMSQGVRTTLDASTGLVSWERLGLVHARREARLADVRGLVMLPASEDGVPTFDPVLTVGKKRWRLAIRSITDAEPVRAAICDVLDLGKGRRSV